MSNFSPKLEDATNEQLKLWINEYDFRVVPLASDELTRRALKGLQETMQIFNEQSSKQTQKMIRLTWGIVGLTIITLVVLVIQIILTL